MNKKVKRLKGISLIVLVITILVLSILAATVIISLSNTNIIGETNKAVLKSNIQSLQDRVTSYTADNYDSIDMKKEYTLSEYGITEEEFKKYQTIAVVKGGKVYIKPNASSDILEVARELNVLLDGTISNTGSLELASTNVKNLRIYGNSIQNGTPSESTPVEIQSVGEKTKNIFDPSQWETPVTQTEITIQYLKDEDCFLLNGTATTTNNYAQKRVNIPTEIGKKYTISTEYVSGSIDKSAATGNRYSVAYIGKSDDTTTNTNWFSTDLLNDNTVSSRTATCDMQYISFFWFYISEGVTFNNYKVKIQIEQSDAATDYEPYGYKVPITVCGKNLIPYPYEETTHTANGVAFEDKGDGSIEVSGTATGYAAYVLSKNIQVEVGKNYILSFNATNSVNLALNLVEYDENRELIKTPLAPADLTKSYTYTPSSEAVKYITLILKRNVDNSECSGVIKPQLEFGNVATEYEPYNGTTYNIYLKEPLRKADSAADYIDCTTGEVVRYIKVKDTTGTKNIEESFEVLTTPTTEKVSVSDIDYTNKKYVSVDTTVIPSSIETRY